MNERPVNSVDMLQDMSVLASVDREGDVSVLLIAVVAPVRNMEMSVL